MAQEQEQEERRRRGNETWKLKEERLEGSEDEKEGNRETECEEGNEEKHKDS